MDKGPSHRILVHRALPIPFPSPSDHLADGGTDSVEDHSFTNDPVPETDEAVSNYRRALSLRGAK